MRLIFSLGYTHEVSVGDEGRSAMHLAGGIHAWDKDHFHLRAPGHRRDRLQWFKAY